MLRLRVESMQWEMADAATFFFAEESGKKISYLAGQFITLVFTHHDEEIRRSYSLSSSPDEPFLAITVKRIANGEISRYMLAKIKVGDILDAVEPAGRFTISDFDSEQELLFFAGGSGITPIFAQLKYILNRAGQSKLTLIYSNQTAETVLFKQQLDKLASEHSERLKIIYLLSSHGDRLNNVSAEALVKQYIGNLPKARFYVCGPFAYMRMIKLTLLFMGVDAGQIRKENFVLETLTVAETPVNYPPRSISIHYHGEVHNITVAENQSVLQAALQNNIALPYSCRAGICSACMAKCVSGKIEMAVNDVLTDSDLSLGWVLTCTGHPVSDEVVVEVL